MKGQDNMLPAVKNYLDKHRKNNTEKKQVQKTLREENLKCYYWLILLRGVQNISKFRVGLSLII